MDFKIERICKVRDVAEKQVLERGTFQVEFPELGITINGFKYKILKEDGVLKVNPPIKRGRTINEKEEQKRQSIKIVTFKDDAVKENIKKALRKELLKTMTPEPDVETTKKSSKK